MKSIRLNIRALAFDGKTPFPSSGRIIHNLTMDSHDLTGQTSGPLCSFGVLSIRDLVANELIAATDHVYVSAVGHSGQSGATSFVVRSRCPAMGQHVATSPTRAGDPSAGTGQVGPFALAAKDELVLTSNARGEQIVTIELLVGTAIEVERRIHRCEQDQEDGEGGAIKLDDLAPPDDTTDLDATTTRHGLLPKLSGDGGAVLSGLGTWISVDSIVDYQSWETPGTYTAGVDGWVKPTRGSMAMIICTGGGGGGGGGGNSGATTARIGGAGGGGAAKTIRIIPLSLLGATETVVVGSGGAGGASATPGTSGTESCFGPSWCFAGGGGGGAPGAATSNSRQGGGGGGAAANGTVGSTSLFSRNEGGPGFAVVDATTFPFGASGGTGCRGGFSGAAPAHAEWGGGGGGGPSLSTQQAGGTSLYGGGGGGHGGFYASGVRVSTDGGASGMIQVGGGGGAAGANSTTSPTAGTAGADAMHEFMSGAGGGGGGGATNTDATSLNGAAGGDGGFPGGGGGGAGSGSFSSGGVGGNGGDGAVYVYVW